MTTDEGNAFYSNSQCMDDYLDEDDDAMKMIKSGEFTSTFDQFMENIEKEITNVEIEENEHLDVEDYHTGNLEFMTDGSRTKELEEGKMIGIGAVINHEYPEGNIIIDYNNYKDQRMNIYIPGLSGKNQDSSLFDEDHYFWGVKNVVNLSHDETINNLNSLIDNLDKWLEPTPAQTTNMVETLMDTEMDDPNDDELNTKDNMDMERNEMNTEMDDPNDDELNTKDNMDMERNEMNTEMDDPNDDELNTKDNMDMERNEMNTEMDDPNDDELNTKDNMDMERNEMNTETDDPNDDELNTKDNMDMERNEMNTETDDPNDDELNTKVNMDMERNEMNTETDDPNDDELNTKDNMDMERNEMNTETDDPNDDELNTKDNMDMERNEMNTETDDPNDGELNNTTQKTEINPEHYMCKELPINIPVVENLLDNDNDDKPGTAANHHIDADWRQNTRGNIFRRFWSYIRKRTKRK